MIADLPLQLSSDNGIFVISLDFELYWGMFDQTELTPEYSEILLRTRKEVIPQMLEMFKQYGIHATWASVGFLFFEDSNALLAGLPTTETTYLDQSLSAYQHLASVGATEEVDPFHYAPSLLKLIQSYPHQEIGSHSFSHYYCLEEGQSPAMFEADLEAWSTVAKQYDAEATTICFARNQYAPAYLAACRAHNIKAYRGNEDVWYYRPDSYNNENIRRKICRWLDTYLPLNAHQCLSLQEIKQQAKRHSLLPSNLEALNPETANPETVTPKALDPETARAASLGIDASTKQSPEMAARSSGELYNIRSSRFYRAYFRKLRWLEPLKKHRILAGMTHAAKHNQIYHLWWHPQDFGQDSKENFETLAHILEHFAELRAQHGMASANMSDIALTLEKAEDTPRDEQL